MRLRTKLMLGIVAAAAVPLLIAGFSGAQLSQGALRKRIETSHAQLAVNAADGVNRFFENLLTFVALVPQLTDLVKATPSVAEGVLRVAYVSNPDLAVVSWLDDTGVEVVPSVYLTRAHADPKKRPAVSDADRNAFLDRVPVLAALAEGHAVGEVAVAGPGREPRVAVAVSFKGSDGQPYLIAVDVSLGRLSRQLEGLSVEGTEVLLVDSRRRAVAGGAHKRAPLSGVALPGDRDPAGPLPAQTAVSTVTVPGAEPVLAAFAPATGTGFGVVVSQEEQSAFAHVSELQKRTLFWLGVSALLALLVGVGLAGSVSRRIGTLSDGTRTLAQGDFNVRLDATGKDELAELSRSFNKMAADLGRAADEIRKQNEEIRGWNEELEKRVEEKTRDLQRAQEMLLRSKSLAAIGTLGAGMAHEINNPLTGVLGAAQLLLSELPEGSPNHALVKDVEKQAQRIRKIVTNLLRLSQQEEGAEMIPVDLNKVVEDALELLGEEELKRARIEIERLFEKKLPTVRGNPAKLQEAVIELISNARKAMPDGGKLTVETRRPHPRVVTVRVSDTGRGIEADVIDKIFDPFFTSKDNWSSTGMGLTLVHKIVEEHHGEIAVDSRSGAGATFTLTFPSDGGRTHLE